MKLAHLVPTKLLAHTFNREAFLCLSNLAVRDSFYAAFHRQQVQAGKLVILDNPVHEDEPINFEEWKIAIQIIRPTVINLPDVIDDWEKTVSLAHTCAPSAYALSPHSELMAVPHGVEHADFLACARQLTTVRPMIDWFGVSLERRLGNDQLAYERRIRRVRILQTEPGVNQRKVHLLGISEQAYELRSPIFRHVESADTSKFAVFALTGDPIFPPAPIAIAYPGRAALGGSTKYFDHEPEAGFDTAVFFESLQAWSRYAEDGVYG